MKEQEYILNEWYNRTVTIAQMIYMIKDDICQIENNKVSIDEVQRKLIDINVLFHEQMSKVYAAHLEINNYYNEKLAKMEVAYYTGAEKNDKTN